MQLCAWFSYKSQGRTRGWGGGEGVGQGEGVTVLYKLGSCSAKSVVFILILFV